MADNLLQIFFLCAAASLGGTALLINSIGEHLPIALTRIYCYGKVAIKADHAIMSKLEIPKRWFKHFYVFAAPASTFVLALTVSKYIFGCDSPNIVHWILDLYFGSQRQVSVSPESTLLATILFVTHCWKRLYESYCVSVYSDAKMNWAHYILAFCHYQFTIFCLIGESEGFLRGSRATLRWDRLSTLQYVCAVIFLWATLEQLQTNCILGNLRRNKKGAVTTKSYKIPHGRLFEYISAPLQFSEMIIYATLSIILWKNSSFRYILLFVLVNQVESARLSHSWCRKTFEDYPKQRKIVIPYLL